MEVISKPGLHTELPRNNLHRERTSNNVLRSQKHADRQQPALLHIDVHAGDGVVPLLVGAQCLSLKPTLKAVGQQQSAVHREVGPACRIAVLVREKDQNPEAPRGHLIASLIAQNRKSTSQPRAIGSFPSKCRSPVSHQHPNVKQPSARPSSRLPSMYPWFSTPILPPSQKTFDRLITTPTPHLSSSYPLHPPTQPAPTACPIRARLGDPG
eukprot:753039-Hanusia_phi.AAC.1